MEKMGNPEAWVNFLRIWKEYLDTLPLDTIRQYDPQADQRIAQVRHWMEVLPSSKSPERLEKGRNYLLDLSYDWYNLVGEANGYNYSPIYAAEDIPGFPISLRTKKTIEKLLYRTEQIFTYEQALLPHLRSEIERLKHVPLTTQTLFSHLESLESAWSKQHFFHKKAKHAVPIHGFFPHKFGGMDLQDRIIALTSVSMHGFNNMHEEDFLNEIEKSIEFLKVGGKYILGPVNQAIYFGSYSSSFDSDGLTRALQSLKAEGAIDYEFIKGTQETPGEVYNWDDPFTLTKKESARSLVITRLS